LQSSLTAKEEALEEARRAERALSEKLEKVNNEDVQAMELLTAELKSSEEKRKAAEEALEQEHKRKDNLDQSLNELKSLISKGEQRDEERERRDEERERRNVQWHHELLSSQEEIKVGIERLCKMGEAHFKMLSTLLKGVDELAPKLICFLPVSTGSKGWLNTLKSPQDWLSQNVCIFFVDPISLQLAQTNDGEGFVLKFPKAWVARALPYVKLGLTMLKVAAVAGKLSGIPFPDVKPMMGEWVDKQLEMLEGLKDEFRDKMAEIMDEPELAADLVGYVDKKCEEMLEDATDELRVAEKEPLLEKLRAPLEKSLKELDDLLKSHHPDWKGKCGLVLVTAHDGMTEWVLPEHKDIFKAQGAKLFVEVTGAKGVALAEQATLGKELRPERLASSSNHRVDAISEFLKIKCQFPSADIDTYVKALVDDGYDSMESLRAFLKQDSLPPIINKAGHRVHILTEVKKHFKKADALSNAGGCGCILA